MKIEMLYDQGSAKIKEDLTIINLSQGIFGVADGVSEPYHPDKGPEKYDGMTGGQMACNCLQLAISDRHIIAGLADKVRWANRSVASSFWLKHPTAKQKEVELIPGACFILAKIDGSTVELLQAGDCLAFWSTQNGEMNGLASQLFLHDSECYKEIERLMSKHGGNRSEMWKEFSPILAQLRRNHVNRRYNLAGYALLNGQLELEECWVHQRIESVRTLILCSDGFLPFEKKFPPDFVLSPHATGGLKEVLGLTRTRKRKTHIDHAEATAIAIEL